MLVFIVTIAVIALCFCFLGIRMILLPEGEFHGTCSTQSEFSDESACGCKKKEANLCPSDDESGTLKIQDLTSLNRHS